MKKLLTALAALAAAAFLFSCEKEKVIELSVSPVAVNFDVQGGSQSVTVSCNDNWTASTTADWITLSPSAGEGNGSLGISVSANPLFDARESTVTVKAGTLTQTVKVGQLGLAPDMKVAPETIEASPAGESVTVSITANVDWQVSIPESITWITADVTSGSNDGTVNLTIAPNASLETRSAAVAINGAMNLSKTISVTQGKTTDPRQTDSLALVGIYNAFGGADKMKSDRVWDLNKPMNEWYGVTLTDGRVSALKFLKGTLTGDWTIPAVIEELTELTDLRFVDCKVGGAIPEGLFTLSKLTALYLTNNNVTGTLSPKIANLKELANLYIDQNPELGGSLPAEIGQLSKLVNLNIAKTSFSGALPQGLTNLDALKNFMAFSTKFSEMPDFWDQLESLELVQLYDIPTLTGPLPASLGRCPKLKNIYMYDCNFEGNIPEDWANLPATMLNVRVQGNKLQGEVPAAVVAHPKWANWKPEQYILPQQEGYGLTVAPPLTPRQLDSLVLVKIYQASDGANWTKDKWDLEQPIDSWKGIKVENDRVIELKLTVSGVIASEWTIPEEVGELTEMKDFRINSNKVTGNLPESLYNLTKLENLYLQNNNITGSLSDKLGQLKELKQIYIDRNANMTGGIPAQIGQLTKLERINISQSGIGGSVPAEIGQCVALLQFMAFKTNLSGELPNVWDLPQLQTVMMHTNPGLTGSLPASLGKLKPLASGTAPSIQLYGCNFTGNIPESFATLPDATKQVHIYENKMSGVVPATVAAHPNFQSWKINPQQEGYGLPLE